MTRTKPDAPTKARESLCAYLKRTNVRQGMRVYGRWYNGVVANSELVRQNPSQDNNRTMFLCYEELAHPESHVHMMHRILNFLFPRDETLTQPRTGRSTSQSRWSTAGHISPPMMRLRMKLKAVVELVDREDFGGMIASLNEQFGCGHDRQVASIVRIYPKRYNDDCSVIKLPEALGEHATGV